ncbi:MAG: DMT family transporter [Thermus sp.]|uniref:DMT family transporter n=1 Tax=Thermus sp. TaxID=275 RepID=UPI0025E1DF8E|nr:DMT family transporter [Thermus sp.]MCS6867954.1 DMT family transporter [Thermus sp.]MCS7218863.1 DMT family transporter [Thermus sp.]MCX7850679.1 DMT family transporter [Thermus sp.]MDW8017632.1 DMT family transporter [Thermus sp.]MDW8356659.1 DMT family transporter [Thermus sp.]
MRGYALGLLALNLLTLLWGTTFVVVKGAVAEMPPSLLVFLRFLLASLFFLPWAFRLPRGVWGPGLELAFWLLLGYASQAVGLLYTSASRSAFITALNVVLVPLLLSLVGRRVPGVWLAALLALLGVGLLSYDPRQPPLNLGDLWTLLTALTYALYIVRLEVHAKAFPALPLTAVQVFGTAFLALPWTLAEGVRLEGVPWGAVLYLGVMATALTTWLQTWGQRYVPAPQAAILYTLEPVWATLFAFLLLGERLGLSGLLGASLVLLATFQAIRRSPA